MPCENLSATSLFSKIILSENTSNLDVVKKILNPFFSIRKFVGENRIKFIVPANRHYGAVLFAKLHRYKSSKNDAVWQGISSLGRGQI